jgi:hypothetical protein
MVWKDVVDRGIKNHESPSSECNHRRMSGDYPKSFGAITNKNGQDKSSCTLLGVCGVYRTCCYMAEVKNNRSNSRLSSNSSENVS